MTDTMREYLVISGKADSIDTWAVIMGIAMVDGRFSGNLLGLCEMGNGRHTITLDPICLAAGEKSRNCRHNYSAFARDHLSLGQR